MTVHSKALAPPSADKRWRIVDATMRRHGYAGDSLIETLHTVQEVFGYLDEHGLRYVAAALHQPLSKIFGVATFYHFFQLKPAGQHTCVICMGTACYIKGAPGLIAGVEKEYGIKPGETTKNGMLSLLTARCLGSCGLAAAAVFDGDVVGRLDQAQLLERTRKWVGA